MALFSPNVTNCKTVWGGVWQKTTFLKFEKVVAFPFSFKLKLTEDNRDSIQI